MLETIITVSFIILLIILAIGGLLANYAQHIGPISLEEMRKNAGQLEGTSDE